jgi:putative acetyltransferase
MLTSDVVHAFRSVSREVVRELELLRTSYANLNVSPQECHALIEIELAPGISPSEIGARLRLDKTAVSRLLRSLRSKGWVSSSTSASDARRRGVALTARGTSTAARINSAADDRVLASLSVLDPGDAQIVLAGMRLYRDALQRSHACDGYRIRPIERADNAAMGRIIRTVMTEHGATGPGYSINDPEVDTMFEAYHGKRAAFFVLTQNGEVVGGAGIAPLKGGLTGTCELRKMYMLPDARGKGFGALLLERCLRAAREFGFRDCYLETIGRMTKAHRLYERYGFKRIARPRGKTGHHTCDVFYVRDLD